MVLLSYTSQALWSLILSFKWKSSMFWFCVTGELSSGPVQVLSLEISPLLPGLHRTQPTPQIHSPLPTAVAKPPDTHNTGSVESQLKAVSRFTAFLSNCLLTIYYEPNKMRGPRGRGVQENCLVPGSWSLKLWMRNRHSAEKRRRH